MRAMDRVALGNRIKATRKAKGITQKGLEGRSGVSERTIQEIEAGNGNPGLSYIEAVEQALKIEVIGLVEPRALDISAEDLGKAMKGLMIAGPARRAYVLFLATRDKAYLERLSAKERQALQGLDLV